MPQGVQPFFHRVDDDRWSRLLGLNDQIALAVAGPHVDVANLPVVLLQTLRHIPIQPLGQKGAGLGVI